VPPAGIWGLKVSGGWKFYTMQVFPSLTGAKSERRLVPKILD